MEKLDNDVLENILFRLPLGSDSSQAKRVCKSWKAILSHRRHNEVGFLFGFIDYSFQRTNNRLHLYFGEEYDHIDIGSKIMNNYYSQDTLMVMEHCKFTFNFSPYCDILVGSCNGLVCFEKLSQDPNDDSFEPFAICNPLTGEFIFLNPNISRAEGRHTLVNSGFGYCQSTNEYKVVRLYTPDSEEGYRSYAQVYTIGSNKWREIETFINHTFCASAIFANGVLHWLDNVDIVGTAIVTFDLEAEEFGELPLPPPEAYDGDDYPWNELKLLGENLCWVKRNDTGIHIWAYKKTNRCGMEDEDDKKHDSKNSWNWVKEFSIKCGRYYKPFAITKSNQVLLLRGKIVYCYDPKARSISKLGDEIAMGFSKVEVIPHANSYVSLKDSGEKWRGPGAQLFLEHTPIHVSISEVKEANQSQKEEAVLKQTQKKIINQIAHILSFWAHILDGF